MNRAVITDAMINTINGKKVVSYSDIHIPISPYSKAGIELCNMKNGTKLVHLVGQYIDIGEKECAKEILIYTYLLQDYAKLIDIDYYRMFCFDLPTVEEENL